MVARTDPDQDRALASEARHLVIVAPPGTGKTSLAARIAARYAIRLKRHERVLLLTFSNQARSELEREVAAHVSAAVRSQVDVTNYHRFFWTLVSRYRRALSLPEDMRITSSRKRQALIRGASRQHSRLAQTALDELAEYRYPGLHPAPAVDEPELEKMLAVVEGEHREGHLVFGDFGALWMRLVVEQPTVRAALQARYPVVIADEHQDSSAIQDALIRDLGTTHVIFADPMQLIHEWRGADASRLERHLQECDDHIVLNTAHRWHDDPSLGLWLLDVRARLAGEDRPGRRPAVVKVTLTDPTHGVNAMLGALRIAVLTARRAGARGVAVMASSNDDVAKIRRFLCRAGMYPAQLGLGHAFDRLIDLPDVLQGMDKQTAAAGIIETIAGLVPGVEATAVTQAQGRLRADSSDAARASPHVRLLLKAADHGYAAGAAGYFTGVVEGVGALRELGFHAPAQEEVRLYRQAARETELETQIEAFERAFAAASHLAWRADSGVLTMTVHQSKGREFDAVILYDASAASFNPADEERMRLFYVAITRARHRWEIIARRGSETRLIDTLGRR